MVKYVTDFFVFSHMIIKRFSISLAFIMYACFSFSQSPLSEPLKNIRQLSDSILRGSTDSVKLSSNEKLMEAMYSFLKTPESFITSFDSIKSISTITSDDKSFRFYQWAMPVYETNSYKIFGFLQIKNAKTKELTTFKLNDGTDDKYTSMGKPLSKDNWYGAIYYHIIQTKIGKKKIYTLLGWRGNNLKTSMKVIDVLSLESDIPKFGMKIFSAPHNMLPVGKANDKYRIIFEYNATAVMSLRYFKKEIIFDHISPAKPSLKGNEEFYGPDFTYDAFVWKKKQWTGKANVEMRNTNNTDGKKPKLIKDGDLKQ